MHHSIFSTLADENTMKENGCASGLATKKYLPARKQHPRTSRP